MECQSHNLLIKTPSLSSWTCARRFLHAEITRISVWVGENPGVFPCRATWSFHEVCTSALYCSITKKGELAIHHQCNSCIMNCCSLRLFKDTIYLSTVLAQDHFYSDTSAYTPVNRTPIIHWWCRLLLPEEEFALQAWWKFLCKTFWNGWLQPHV